MHITNAQPSIQCTGWSLKLTNPGFPLFPTAATGTLFV